jgi:hypothetical protein
MNDSNNRDRKNRLMQEFRKRSRDRREVYPGISRGDAFLYGGGVLLYTLLVCTIAFFIILATQGRAAEDAAAREFIEQQEATQVARLATESYQATQLATQQTATAFAELPPSATPTSRSVFEQLGPTTAPTATPTVETIVTLPPPPETLTGVIVGWGGRNPVTDEFLDLQTYNPAAADSVTSLEQDFVRNVSSDNALRRILYFGLDTRNNDEFIYRYDTTVPADERLELLEERWSGQGFIEPEFPAMSRGGRYMAFVAGSLATERSLEVYRYDFVADQLLRLTGDEFEYGQVAISPDGSRIVVIRFDDIGNDHDMVLLEAPLEVPADVPDLVSATTVQQLTTDGNDQLEQMPSFSADGTQLVYTVTTPDTPENHDIYLYPLNAAPLPFIGGPDDEIYPVFSPDGAYIAYASDTFGSYDIFIQNIRTSETYQLTRTQDEPDIPGAWVTGEENTPAAEATEATGS